MKEKIIGKSDGKKLSKKEIIEECGEDENVLIIGESGTGKTAILNDVKEKYSLELVHFTTPNTIKKILKREDRLLIDGIGSASKGRQYELLSVTEGSGFLVGTARKENEIKIFKEEFDTVITLIPIEEKLVEDRYIWMK